MIARSAAPVLLCPAASGHLHPITTLGHALRQRGHRVSLIGIADAEERVRAADAGDPDRQRPARRGCPGGSAIDQVWGNPSYRQKAQRLQQAIASSGGVARAAYIVEQAIRTGQAVL